MFSGRRIFHDFHTRHFHAAHHLLPPKKNYSHTFGANFDSQCWNLKNSWSKVIYPGLPIMGPPYGKRDPYYSHTIPISLGILMGVQSPRQLWKDVSDLLEAKKQIVQGNSIFTGFVWLQQASSPSKPKKCGNCVTIKVENLSLPMTAVTDLLISFLKIWG